MRDHEPDSISRTASRHSAGTCSSVSANATAKYALYLGVEVAAAMIKLVYKTDRPSPESKNSWFETYQSGSFPSIHTARITYLAAILAVFGMIPPFLSILLFILTALVGYSRIILKKHYYKDVVGGFALGALFGLLAKFL